MQISVQEASDQLRKQVEDLQERVAELMTSRAAAGAAAVSGAEQTAPRPSSPGAAAVLWVDDNPANNVFEVTSGGTSTAATPRTPASELVRRLRDADVEAPIASTRIRAPPRRRTSPRWRRVPTR